MAFEDLRDFIAALEKQKEAVSIAQEVDWNLEAGAILRRTYELGLPAPFFQRIKGYPKGYRMFGGTLGTHRRLALAWGLDPKTNYRDLMEYYLGKKDKTIKPILVKDAPCKENIHIGEDVDLLEFPAPMLHDGDGGRYLCSWHCNISKDPDTGWVNWGMYRAMILTKNTMAGLVEPHKHIGYHHLRKYEPRDEPMPVAIAIGTDPISSLMALSAVPPGVDEVDIAGALQGKPTKLVKCETIDLEVSCGPVAL